MIYFYSGTPGSGKSLRVAKDIVAKLLIKKQNVITNMVVDYDYIVTSNFKVKLNNLLKLLGFKKQFNTRKKGVGEIIYLPNDKMTPSFLFEYAYKNHQKAKEGQTLLVMDEAQMMFGPTVVKLKTQENKEYRVQWLDFFTQHRHLGYNIVMISQFDRLIDAQIRCLFEYNYIHRKVNNFGLGWILSVFRMSLFVSAEYWYGVKEKTGVSFFTYRKKYSRIYNSYSRWDDREEQKQKEHILDVEKQADEVDLKDVLMTQGKVVFKA